MDELFDPLRKKAVSATPEEKVRQWFISEILSKTLLVPSHLMLSEVQLLLGKKIWRADILVYDHFQKPLAVVECKRPEVVIDEKVCNQALRYNEVLDVEYILLTNGKTTFAFEKSTEGFKQISSIPTYEQMTEHRNERVSE